MKNKTLSTLALLLLGASLTSNSASAGEHVIIVKAGTYTIDDRTQVIDVGPLVSTVFDEDAGTFGVEYDHVFDSGLSIGGGYQSYNMDYTSSAGPGDYYADFLTFNAKAYFTDSSFKPYIGGSFGLVGTDFDGAITGNSVGIAIGAMAGFRWQFSVVGLYAEYKNFFSADTEDSDNAEVDLAGESITGGISISF